MKYKIGPRLIWDNKGLNRENPNYLHQEIERIFPNPLFQADNLFYNEANTGSTRESRIINRLFQGDNLGVIKLLLDKGYEGKIDLIYIDPPYLSEANYRSRIVIGDKKDNQVVERYVFKDSGIPNIDSYLDSLYSRLYLMKKLLSSRGSIFVHLDWHVSHYVKLLLDEIFSPGNFINEIIWCYGGGSGSKRHFHRKHDSILWYAAGEDYIFNPQYRPYSPGTIERGLTQVKGNKYSLREQGAIMQDWWTDINKILSPTARENLKFPTQKPAKLLKRLISAASNPGSLVADFYAGSGTTAQVCEEIGRNWIACDTSKIAVQTCINRLIKQKPESFSVEKVMDNSYKTTDNTNILHLKEPVINILDEASCSLYTGIDNYIPCEDNLKQLNNEYSFASLISFWEIDLDYNGRVFNSDIQVIRQNNQFDQFISLDLVVRLPRNKKQVIAIKLYDVFGKTVMNTLEPNIPTTYKRKKD